MREVGNGELKAERGQEKNARRSMKQVPTADDAGHAVM